LFVHRPDDLLHRLRDPSRIAQTSQVEGDVTNTTDGNGEVDLGHDRPFRATTSHVSRNAYDLKPSILWFDGSTPGQELLHFHAFPQGAPPSEKLVYESPIDDRHIA